VGFLFNRTLSRKGIRKVGLGMSVGQAVSVSAPGFTPSPSPVSGTNYTVIGPSTGNITLSAGSPEPANIKYRTERTREIGSETTLAALADIFVTGGGGSGGGAGDLGNAGGGGGGGVVYYPGVSLSTGVGYPAGNPSGAANPAHFGSSPQPVYLVAVRGGSGGSRGNTGVPGGSGGGYNTTNQNVGTGYQDISPSPFGQPGDSITYGHGTPGSGLTGGSSGQPMPTAMWGGNPMSPYIPQNEFGRGVNRSSPGDQGSGCGGNGSNPPGNSGQGPGSAGSVVVRVYSP